MLPIKVLYFARARELAGLPEEVIDVAESELPKSTAMQILLRGFPVLNLLAWHSIIRSFNMGSADCSKGLCLNKAEWAEY